LLVWRQPATASHESVVHGLPSSQFAAACWQPLVVLHESTVHALPSSQLTAAF